MPVIPSGALALNALGLSQQVPFKLEFKTAGPSRTIQLGKREIRLRHASPRRFRAHSRIVGLVIEALDALGRENTTPETTRRSRSLRGRFGTSFSPLGAARRSVRAEEQIRSVEVSAADERRPSEVFEQYWIHAQRKDPDSYPEHGERGGKWMLFVKTAEIDEWWAKIKAATQSGLLGSSAKAATMKPNPNTAANDTRLICVYTYDLDDERDCSRVRQALRDLGVAWKIPYKTDADTYAGKYAQKGVRVSKRYE